MSINGKDRIHLADCIGTLYIQVPIQNTSSPMGNDRSPESRMNVRRHHYLQYSKAGNSELETVIRPKFNTIHFASSAYLQVLKRSELKWGRKPGELFSEPQGQLTPLSVVGSDRNSNSSKLLCMSLLPIRMKKTKSK